jgi:outer membrane protein
LKNNLSLILNIVLLIAVVFLFYKVYSPKNAAPEYKTGTAMPANAIVFINSDSLLDNYNYFNVLKQGLEKKQDSIQNYLQSQAQLLERDVKKYQDQAPQMSGEQRAAIEEKLMMRQQSLMETKQTMLGDLQDEESDMNDSIHDNLSRYLKEYNKNRNYLYILGYQRGSGILFANDSLDITSEILEGLNSKK